MTIECYLFLCPNHSFHEEGPDEGPFCFEEKCQRTRRYTEYVKQFQDVAIKNQNTLASVPLVPIKLKDS